MALDPTISLGIKTPEPIDFSEFAKLRILGMQPEKIRQEIEASKTEQRAREAQIPGQQADSEVKQRGLRFNNWLTKNQELFTGRDGKVDHGSLVRQATAAGFGNEARELAKTDITRTGLEIKNIKDKAAAEGELFGLHAKTLAYGGHFFSNIPEAQQGEHIEEVKTQLNNMVPGSGDNFVKLVVRKNPVTGNILLDKDGKPVVDKAMVDSLRLSGMSAETQETLAQAGSERGIDKESRDPNSEKSRRAAIAAIDAGIPNVEIGKTSYSELQNNSQFKALIQAAIVPGQYKGDGSAAADKLKADANRMGTAASLVEQLIQSGDLQPGNKVSSILSMAIDRVKNKPAHAALKALLTEITPNYPSINIETGDGPSIAAALRALQVTTMNTAGQMSKRTKIPTFNKMDNGTPTDAPPPVPNASGAPRRVAPQAAIDALKRDPSLADQFKAKYGYLP